MTLHDFFSAIQWAGALSSIIFAFVALGAGEKDTAVFLLLLSIAISLLTAAWWH